MFHQGISVLGPGDEFGVPLDLDQGGEEAALLPDYEDHARIPTEQLEASRAEGELEEGGVEEEGPATPSRRRRRGLPELQGGGEWNGQTELLSIRGQDWTGVLGLTRRVSRFARKRRGDSSSHLTSYNPRAAPPNTFRSVPEDVASSQDLRRYYPQRVVAGRE